MKSKIFGYCGKKDKTLIEMKMRISLKDVRRA
jgi:hypothetical protein